jgi:putative transposase
VRTNQAQYPIAIQCRVLELSVSGYYAWLHRETSRRQREDDGIAEVILGIYHDSDRTYGAARIHADLRLAHDIRVSRKRVARLMREYGLAGVHRRRWIVTTVREKRARPAPDLVNRNFTATAPNQLYVADITYIPTWSGFLFLAVVVDAFSRKVVGWAMDTNMRSQLIIRALEMAMKQRKARGVIHHSDQGSQYTSFDFGERCKKFGVRPSMGSVGDCYDNAMCESFFATLECELLDRTSFRNPREAELEIFRFIEGWYNTRRRHSSISYCSPNEYEQQYQREQNTA